MMKSRTSTIDSDKKILNRIVKKYLVPQFVERHNQTYPITPTVGKDDFRAALKEAFVAGKNSK